MFLAEKITSRCKAVTQSGDEPKIDVPHHDNQIVIRVELVRLIQILFYPVNAEPLILSFLSGQVQTLAGNIDRIDLISSLRQKYRVAPGATGSSSARPTGNLGNHSSTNVTGLFL